MRVLIAGDLIAVRFVNTKDGMVSYFDVLQHASKNFQSEVVHILCNDLKIAKSFQNNLHSLIEVKVIIMCNLTHATKDFLVSFVELIDMKGEELNE